MEIKILHFIPNIPSDEGFTSFFETFLSLMTQQAEVHLATLSPAPSFTPAGCHLHCIGSGKSNYGKNGYCNLLALQKQYLKLLYNLMPDLIHVHGSYHFINSRIALWSKKRGFPVVFSPYGGMNPDYIEAEYGMRTWKIISYQKKMTTEAGAVLSSDPKESEYLHSMHPTPRVEFISDPRNDEYWGDENYTHSTMELYHKVLNSDKGIHIDQNSREALSALLHLSLTSSTERTPLCSEDILNLRSITASQWHDIYLFAAEQGVVSNIEEGIAKAQLNVPGIDINTMAHFEPRHPKDHSPLPSDTLLSKNRLTNRKIFKELRGSEDVIRITCIMLLNIKHHLKQHTLSMRHLCEIYAVFRFDKMNEDKLAETLSRLGLLKFAQRICQVLSEMAYLDEGYMPVSALDDQGTRQIRQNLMKY